MIDAVIFGHQTLAPAKPNQAERDAARAFEAVLLTGFVEGMLPENMGGTQTGAPGADVWRSFLAAAVADQLAGQNLTGLSGLVSEGLSRNREAD